MVLLISAIVALALALVACGELGEESTNDIIENLLEMVDIPGGEYVSEAPPEPTGSADSPKITDVIAPGTLVNGQSFDYEIDFDDPDGENTVEDLLIAFGGIDGYFRVPVNGGDGRASVMITILELWQNNSTKLSFAVRDEDGNVSDYMARNAEVRETGSGDIKVTLSFNKDTDVDLHVVDPSGFDIFWGQRESSSGGKLDLDSNAGCLWIDGINVENVFWPEGAAPKGEYTVRADYYLACKSAPVQYIVTVMVHDEVQTFRGEFTADDQDVGAAGSGRTITTFIY